MVMSVSYLAYKLSAEVIKLLFQISDIFYSLFL